jgi:hypothetical protein
MGQTLERKKLPQLSQEEIDDPNGAASIKEVELVLQNSSKI